MSKKLDEEYKALIASEVPDLWDRIDSGLKPKNAAAAEDVSKEEKAAEEPVPAPKKKKTIFKVLPWIGGAAAAAVIFAIALPVILLVGFNKNKTMKSADYAPEQVAAEAVYMDEMVEERGGLGMDTEETAMAESADISAGAYAGAALGSADMVPNTESEDFGEYIAEDAQDAVNGIQAFSYSLRQKGITESAGEQTQTAAGEQAKTQTAAGERDEAEESFYIRIDDFWEDEEGTTARFACSDVDELTNTDNSLALEEFEIKISPDSEEECEIGGVYLAKIDDYGIYLVKKITTVP